jgi:hypothetical protein
MHKNEQAFCTALQKWLKYNMKHTCFIEAKVSVATQPFNFKSGFKPHQLPTLLAIKNGPLAYKISDLDRMTKPLDIFFAYRSRAYVAIHWVRKGNKTFYMLDPVAIQGLLDDGKKSLTEEGAEKYCEFKGVLK